MTAQNRIIMNIFRIKNMIEARTFVVTVMLFMSLVFFSVGLYAYLKSRPVTYIRGEYSTGMPIATGSATLVLNKIRYDKGQGSFQAPENKLYIVIDMTVQNNTGKPLSVLPSTQVYLKDEKGYVYYLAPFSLELPFRAGELSAGDKISGEISYLIPKNSLYTMYIDAIWSGGVVSVALPKGGI